MNEETIISVIIPVYNHPMELQRAITSVLGQTWQDFEVLVVDDGSEEDIEHVCNSFGDKRIKYIRNEVHKNANAARNRGIKEATGKYIAMLDADDEYLPEHLSRRIEKIEEWYCDGIFGSAFIFDGTKETVKKSRPLRKDEKMADYLLTDGFCPTPSHFYKAEAVRKTLWDEALHWNQDYDFSIRFAAKFDFRCDPEPTVRVHWHKGHKQKLTGIHFESQKKFIEKHKKEISQPALVNYFYSMKKEALETGNKEQVGYYDNELRKTAGRFKAFYILSCIRIKALLHKIFNSI